MCWLSSMIIYADCKSLWTFTMVCMASHQDFLFCRTQLTFVHTSTKFTAEMSSSINKVTFTDTEPCDVRIGKSDSL